MPTQQLIDIIIKATDQASSTADKVDQKLKQMYGSVNAANEKAARSGEKFNAELIRTGESFQVVGGGAAQAANLLGQVKLDPNFGSTIDRAKLKVSQMGYDISSVQGKIRVFGAAVPMAFTKMKNSVSQVATQIKGKLATALDGARQKLAGLSSGAKGFSGVLGGLKSIGSMTVGMIGYDLVTGMVQAARASINAASQVEYFGQRLSKASGQTRLSSQQFSKFKTELSGLQKEFRKVDMTAVGATAEEIALKMNLPANKLGDLTRMTAVLSSTFVKEGRTQEDAVLAVSDALDGQFKRLQEIGISQDTLKKNGWNGNLEDQGSLIDAINKSMQEMGYEQTAKDITNLDEAWTALTVAGGQLLQKALVPITPALIGIIDALLKVADVVGPVIGAFASAVANMPDWAKYAGLIGVLAVAVNMVAAWISATLVPALAAAALAALDFAAAMLANPLTWIVVALAAVALAIYEVGKAFGWWTDVSSMLDAVWDGIQRLWDAFINHPDVQATIQALSQAWDVLSSAIGGVISWIGSFFEASNGGNFDVVRALIDGIGIAWEQLTFPIRTVITIVQTLANLFSSVGSSQIDILTAVTTVWDLLKTYIGNVLLQIASSIVNWGIQIFTAAVSAGQRFVFGVINYLQILPLRMLMLLILAYNNVRNQFTKMVTTARAKARAIVTGVVNTLTGLPGKALNLLLKVVHSITSAGGQWVSNARSKASSVVSAVTGQINDLPGKVYTEFMNIGSRMISAGSSLVQKAKNIGQNIVKGLLDSMGIHSPGIIQEKVVQEFVDTVANVARISDRAGRAGELVGSSIVDGFNSVDLQSGELFDARSGLYVVGEAESTINLNETLTLDLKNVPSNLDSDELMRWLKSAVGDKGLIRTLVENRDFQELDRKMKETLAKKAGRRM